MIVDRHGGGLEVRRAAAAFRIDKFGVGFLLVRITWARFHLGELLVDRGDGGTLHVAVECGVDLEPGAVEHVLRKNPFQFAPEQFHGPILLRRRRFFRGKHERLGLRGEALAGRNVALVFHLLQDDVALLQSSVGVAKGREAIGAADEAGEQCRFGQSQIRRRLAEIVLRRRFDAEQPGAEIDAVHVVREDFVLREDRFHAQGQRGLENFAVHVLPAKRETVASQLLGQRAAALADAACGQVGNGRTADADRIHTEVLEKSPVFAGDDGANKPRAHFVQWHRAAVLAGQARVNLAVAIDDQGTFRNTSNLAQVEGPCPSEVKCPDQSPQQKTSDDEPPEAPRALTALPPLARARPQQADAAGAGMAGG